MGMSQFDKERQRQRAINQSQALINAGISPPGKQVIPPIRQVGPKDMYGREFVLGARVVRPVKIGNSNGLKVCSVTHIAGPQVYCDNSMRPIGHPERLLILEIPAPTHVFPTATSPKSTHCWPFATSGS